MGNTLSEIRRRGAREAARKASSPDRVRSAREVLEEKSELGRDDALLSFVVTECLHFYRVIVTFG